MILSFSYDIINILEDISSTSQSKPEIKPSPVTAEQPNIVQWRPPMSAPRGLHYTMVRDRYDSNRYDSDRFDRDRCDSDRCGSDRFDSDRFDSDMILIIPIM